MEMWTASRRSAESAPRSPKTLNGRVIGEHRDEKFAFAGIANAVGDFRARARQGFSLAARAIVDDEMMASF
jgi:hypothetical protein